MANSNIQELTINTLASRMEHLSSISYTNATALVKSAVVVISAQVILSIWSISFTVFDALERTAFWILSAMLAGVTQITWIQGYLFPTSRVEILDFFVPIWVGMFEVLLFMCSDPHLQIMRVIKIPYQPLWLLIAGGHLLSCSALVANRIYLFRIEHFSDALREIPVGPKQRPLAQAYKSWIKADCIASFTTALIFFLMFCLVALCIGLRSESGARFCLAISAIIVLPIFFNVCLNMRSRIRLVEHAIVSVYP